MPLKPGKDYLNMKIGWLINQTRKNHALTMILCCAIPIGGILLVSSMGIPGNWVYIALILICPLGHVSMMRAMQSTPEDAKFISSPDKTDNR